MSRTHGITQQAMIGAVTDLAGSAPLSETFWSQVRRHSHRAIELVPVATQPGEPSGLWCRTAGTDYLYYECQTSPFHQAHILLHLAAQVLLSNPSGLTIHPWLVPDLDPELVRLILGGDVEFVSPGGEAENLAILALERVNRRPVGFTARRMLRQLQPLHTALLTAVPEAARAMPQSALRARLHQAVVEIRDAMLALRPYWDGQLVEAACRQADAAGLTGDDRAASVEVAVLAAAVRAKAASLPALAGGRDRSWQHVPGGNLPSEAAWLVKVSHAFAQNPSAVQYPDHRTSAVLRATSGRRFTGAGAVALGSWFLP